MYFQFCSFAVVLCLISLLGALHLDCIACLLCVSGSLKAALNAVSSCGLVIISRYFYTVLLLKSNNAIDFTIGLWDFSCLGAMCLKICFLLQGHMHAPCCTNFVSANLVLMNIMLADFGHV